MPSRALGPEDFPEVAEALPVAGPYVATVATGVALHLQVRECREK